MQVSVFNHAVCRTASVFKWKFSNKNSFMDSDNSSFGWESLSEDRSSLSDAQESHLKTPKENNTIMVKVEKTLDESHKNGHISSPELEKKLTVIKKDEVSPLKSEINKGKLKNLPVNNITFSASQSRATSVPNGSQNQFILDKYLENAELRLVTEHTNYSITDEDDIWLVQSPKNIDINCLVGMNFLQKGKKKFKIGDSSYECVLSPKNLQDKISFLLPPTDASGDYKMNAFDLGGIYIIREKINTSHEIEVCEQPTENIPFPSNLKKRHPLLGVNFKELIELPNKVKKILKSPVNKYRILKKTQEVKVEIEDVQMIEKPKRKRKTEQIDLDDSLNPPKKIKKENDTKWMSELSIEKSLFELPSKSTKRKSIK